LPIELVLADPPARLVVEDVDELLLQWLLETGVAWFASGFPLATMLLLFAWCWNRTFRRACVVEDVWAVTPLGSVFMTTFVLLGLLALLLLRLWLL